MTPEQKRIDAVLAQIRQNESNLQATIRAKRDAELDLRSIQEKIEAYENNDKRLNEQYEREIEMAIKPKPVILATKPFA